MRWLVANKSSPLGGTPQSGDFALSGAAHTVQPTLSSPHSCGPGAQPFSLHSAPTFCAAREIPDPLQPPEDGELAVTEMFQYGEQKQDENVAPAHVVAKAELVEPGRVSARTADSRQATIPLLGSLLFLCVSHAAY